MKPYYEIYDFLNYILNDMTGVIGENFIEFEKPVISLINMEPNAVHYYSMFIKMFNEHKKYLKKQAINNINNINNIPTLSSTLSSYKYSLKNDTHNEKIFRFCLILWLHIHH